MRWRIAAVSATLTFLILLCFALVVGRLAANKLDANFREETQSTANDLANRLQVGIGPTGLQINPRGVSLDDLPLSGDITIRVVDSEGAVVDGVSSGGFPSITPNPGDPVNVGHVTAASAQIVTSAPIGEPIYAQVIRNRASVEATADRLWLFLAVGVLGGTILATLAGLAVAQRAMRPISSLTAAARDIATTRDPSRRLPMPESEDEVAELATTLDQMLRELDAARSENEQMVQRQREFVADASHELRTPLTSVLANLELLQARLAERGGDAEDGEILAGALGSSLRMRRLVSDLLLLAKADAGRQGARRRCDLAEIAATAIAELRSISDLHSIELEAAGAVEANVNPDDLHRLIGNLVENAVRHTPPGTNVAVSVREEDDKAVIEVTDDGPGLPGDLGDQIFGRFVRGSGPADRATGSGTGLGLAIVKAVATAHGGRVAAGTSESGGARFTVTLPRSLSEQGLAKHPATVS